MVFEKVAALIAEKIDCYVTEIKPETKFEDLSIDSLDITEISMSIEDEFDIEFEPAQGMETVADLVAEVEKKLA